MSNMKNNLTQELGQNFIDYAAAVNSDRAIPDAASGLKPVARRILYSAYDTGRSSNKPHVKCATIVGDCMGRFHPHGDSSIYSALVRLAQNWVMRYPLIDFHGNIGNIGGDGPAAYRYTEARLAPLTEEGLLLGLKKKNVPFQLNFDDSIEEPATLPAIFPNLLCNPNTGIGVALACSWASHNLREVGQAINDYLDGKEPMLPGPDFPTGGVIINKNDIPNIMRTGHGSVKIRGKYKIEGNTIIFYEVPYGIIVENLLTQIGELAESQEIVGIYQIRDESNKLGLRIAIECEKSANIIAVLEGLFAKTDLQSSFSYNQVALVNKVPTELNLTQCIEIYIQHNIDCLVKEAQYDLDKAIGRQEIVAGLLIALEDIDNVIKLIKASENSSAAKVNLMKQYSLSEVQAKAIVEMKLGKLAHLEKIELENENKELLELIQDLHNLLKSRDIQITTIRDRLNTLVNKFGDDRRTELTQITVTQSEEEEVYVEPEKCVVIMTESGLIKRIPAASFKTQKRGGKGVKSTDDIANSVIRTNTVDSLMIFSNRGKMYRLSVNDIPEGTNTSKGQSIKSLVPMEANEDPAVIYSIYKETDAKYVLFATKNGLLKKTTLDEYIKTKKKGGVLAINIKDDDELIAVSLVKEEPLVMVTTGGMTIKIDSNEVPATGRSTIGVKGLLLMPNDTLAAILPIRDENDKLAVFSESGLGKKFSLEEIPLQKRGGKGVICYKSTATSGPVAAASLVADEDDLLIVGDKSMICISAKDIPEMGRAASGNQLIKNSKILSVSKV